MGLRSSKRQIAEAMLSAGVCEQLQGIANDRPAIRARYVNEHRAIGTGVRVSGLRSRTHWGHWGFRQIQQLTPLSRISSPDCPGRFRAPLTRRDTMAPRRRRNAGPPHHRRILQETDRIEGRVNRADLKTGFRRGSSTASPFARRSTRRSASSRGARSCRQTPDGFLADLYDKAPGPTVDSLANARLNLNKSHVSASDFIDILNNQKLAQLATRLKKHLTDL